MSNITATNASPLADLTAGHSTFTNPEEIGSDAATEAPATSPFCAGVVVGLTLTLGC